MVQVPNAEALIELLKSDGAPPWLMIDLTGSDFDGDGVVCVGLSPTGELVEVQA